MSRAAEMLRLRLDMLFARLAPQERRHKCCAYNLTNVSSLGLSMRFRHLYRASPLRRLRLLECGAGI